MDIDLRLPSGEHAKEEEEEDVEEEGEEEEEPNGTVNMMFDSDEKLHNGDGLIGNMVVVVEEKLHGDQEEDDVDPTADMGGGGSSSKVEDTNLEPLAGMEFESHGAAYSFYQEYARSIGFNTAIQNSRRSKTSREFIDAKFACSRYGTKREYENKSLNNNNNNNNSNNRPQRSRQGNKQDPENASGRRSCAKTDCKASMHVKRRPDGKWIIHRFEKEHNHELLPAQAVSEQTRKMYAAMARQFAEYKNVVGLKNDSKNPFDKGRNLPLEPGEANILVDFFMRMQCVNSNFFYAMDVGEDQRMRNLFWADAKSRHDYLSFGDVVCFDTSYVRNKYKMPLAVFVGVNQHYQFMLLGCALLSDESAATFLWVMRTWLKAMGGQAPKVMITEQYKSMKLVISSVFPSAQHYFCLWHIMGKFSSETLLSPSLIKQKKDDNFVKKLEKCVYRSGTEEEFERRWQKLVERFELKGKDWIQTLYEDRKQWVPTYYYMKEDGAPPGVLAGMSMGQRSESVNSFFDKYVHKKTTVQEFVKQYESILQDRYEEEAKADSDTWNKAPSLKSPSPFEKHMSGLYTHAVFKKFQAEVLGAVACIPRREKNDGSTAIFKVQDFEKSQEFTVTWDEMKTQVSCVCRLFELRGFLCRHAMIVLQICGLSTIPSQYILKRWMKDAKSSRWYVAGSSSSSEQQQQAVVLQSRVQRYNDLCQRAVRLGEEGSLSQESYNFALRALEDAFGNCVDLNNSNKNLLEAGTSAATPGLLCPEEDNNQRSNMNNKTNNKKKNPTKKRKVNSEPDVMAVGTQDSIQQMDKMSSRQVALDGFLCQQQSMQGVVPLNLLAPPRDNYYGNQQTTVQGIGHLTSIAPNHDSYYGTQPTMHGLAQMDFFRGQVFPYGIREDPNVRSAQLHDDASRHA